MAESDVAATPRRRSTDGRRTDHDLLVSALEKLDAILARLDNHSQRLATHDQDISALKLWRAEHSAVSVEQIKRIDDLSHGDHSHDQDISALELWRAEMRGAFAALKIGLTAIGALSGLSVILEILRLVGALH